MNNISNNATYECDEILLNTNYDPFIVIVCSALALIGLVYTFFGYRCFQAVLFLSGCVFGGTLVFLLCQDEKIFDQKVSFELAIGIAAGIGVVCGFITLLIRYVGLFLVGFFLGTLLSFSGLFAMQAFYIPPTPWVPIGIIFIVGSLFAVLTLAFQKRFFIISTAVIGSFLIVVCIDYFVENFTLMRYAWQSLMANASSDVCWFVWMLVVSWVVLSVVGIILQWKVTSKGQDHNNAVLCRRRKPPRPSRGGGSSHSPDTPRDVEENPRSESPCNVLPGVFEMAPPAFEEVEEFDPDAPPPSYYECVGHSVSDDCSVDVGSIHPISEAGDAPHPDVNQSEHDVYPIGDFRSQSNHSLNSPRMRELRNDSTEPRRIARPHSMFPLPSDKNRKAKRISSKYRNRDQPRQRASSTSAANQSEASASDRNDMQSLLSDASRARSGQGAVSAHAERLRAAENRRLSRQNSAR